MAGIYRADNDIGMVSGKIPDVGGPADNVRCVHGDYFPSRGNTAQGFPGTIGGACFLAEQGKVQIGAKTSRLLSRKIAWGFNAVKSSLKNSIDNTHHLFYTL